MKGLGLTEKQTIEELEEEEKEEEEETIQLGNDIYCYTFFKFATSKDVSAAADLMMLCFLTIIIQIFLIAAKY